MRTLPKAWRDDHWKESANSITKGYIRFFEPDVYIEAEEGLHEKAGLQALKSNPLENAIIPLSEFFIFDETPRKGTPHFGLSIVEVLREIYGKERKFVLRENVETIQAENSAKGTFVESVIGCYPKGEKFNAYRRNFGKVFDAKQEKVTPDLWTRLFTKHIVDTPLGITEAFLEIENYNSIHDPTIFVYDPKSPLDVIDLWNIRIQNNNFYPVPIEWIPELSEVLTNLCKQYHESRKSHQPNFPNAITLEVSRSISSKKLKHAEATIKSYIKGPVSLKSWRDQIWQPNNPRGPTITRLSIVHDKKSHNSTLYAERERWVQIEAISPKFASTCGGKRARWVNIIQFNKQSTENITTYFPFNNYDRKWPRISISIDFVGTTSEGIVIPQQFKTDSIIIQPINGFEAITSWLEDKGVTAQISDAGRIAKEILIGMEGTWGLHLLAHRDTIKLLNKMAGSARKRKNEEHEIEEFFPDRSRPVKDWKDMLARRAQSGEFRRIDVSGFTKRNVIRLGVNTKCPSCSYENWHGLDALGYEISCLRCLKPYPFPEGELKEHNRNWHYRAIGPYAVPDYADGAYAALLTIRLFAELLGRNCEVAYMPATDLKPKAGKPCEVDFMMWRSEERIVNRRGPEPEFIIGEAKSFADEAIMEKDLDQIRYAASILPRCSIVISVLKDAFSTNEKQILTKFVYWARTPAKDGKPIHNVFLLTGRELFSNRSVRDSWEKAGGKFKVCANESHVDLFELSDTTQQLYLGIDSYWKSKATTIRPR